MKSPYTSDASLVDESAGEGRWKRRQIDQDRPFRATVIRFSHSLFPPSRIFNLIPERKVGFIASFPPSDYQAIAAIASQMRGPPLQQSARAYLEAHAGELPWRT
jgi:hypothetical protein